MDPLQRQPPPGLSIVSQSAEEVVIDHQRVNNFGLPRFIGGLAIVFLIVGIWPLLGHWHPWLFEGGRAPSLWFIAVWYFISLLALWKAITLSFCRATIRLTSQAMEMRHRVGIISWRTITPVDGIELVRQMKDGGVDDDSFTSWGLYVGGPQGWLDRSWRTVISREQRSQSDWLGPVLAEWYEVPYQPAENDQN